MKKIICFSVLLILISCIYDIETPLIINISENLNLSSESIVENDSQSSIFITRIEVDVDPALIENVRFTVKKKESTISDEISAIYSRAKVDNGNNIVVPVFGLYENYLNKVEILIRFTDFSTTTLNLDVETPAYDDPQFINADIQIVYPPSQDNKPSFSFFLLQPNTSNIDTGNNANSFGGVIMDIDGNIRWVRNRPLNGPYVKVSRATVFIDKKIITMQTGTSQPSLITFDLSGSNEVIPISNTSYPLDDKFWPHHDMRSGKSGVLIEVNVTDQSVGVISGQVLIEVNDTGQVLKEFDFGDILSNYMLANGDDPSNLNRSPVNWFHGNSSLYNPADNSIITSSRENFIMKIGYDDKEIKWIFGDPSKHWFVNFPSLRSLALSTDSDYPIGQHAVSIDGDALMFYNNGTYSFRNPDNTPAGVNPNISLASKYIIDAAEKTATRIWNYEPNLYSGVCSSIFRDTANGDYLLNHSAVGWSLNGGANQEADNIFEGINENKEVLFKFLIKSSPCLISWNTKIVDLNNLAYN